MITDKKNQHYVPKFYLRNFSYKNNQKQIGIYNLKSAFFHQTAKLKTQGSKNFFYGQDGIIENHLSDIEGLLASEIKNILSNQTLPSKNSAGHSTLLTFVGLTHLRNPTLIDYFRESREEMRRKLLEINKDINLDKFVPEIPHEIAVNMSLSVLKDVKNHIMDLNYKLLINKTEVSFISSDFPVVKYNQFLEKKKWNHGKTGYGNTGLQIFIPLNSKIILMLYDSTVYKVGFKKQPNLDISNKKDIDQLNILQILNSYSTLFFDEKITNHYITSLIEKSKKFTKANTPTSKLTYGVKKGNKQYIDIENKEKNVVIIGSTDCEINLEITGIKIHSNAHKVKLSNSLAQLRPNSIKLRKNDRKNL